MSNKYKVISAGLNFRSSPGVNLENLLATLPNGQIVRKISENQDENWWKVSTVVAGQELVGFVAHEFLINVDESLMSVIEDNQTISLEDLQNKKHLVAEIQRKLRNLGYYPGGQWIDGLLGSDSSRTSRGLNDFCTALNLTLPTTQNAMNPTIAQALLETQQIDSVLQQASNQDAVLNKLENIQAATGLGAGEFAYLDRTIKNSPFESDVQGYPVNLAQQPDGTAIISYGKTITLAGSGQTVTFDNYPDLGTRPSIDGSSLNFLNNGISRACICVGSFVPEDDEIKAHWLGKQSLVESQYLSSTKFIGVLNTISKLNALHPSCDVDNCVIGHSHNNRRHGFYALVEDMHTYAGRIASSNSIAAMFKRFSERAELESWIRSLTGNDQLQFRGYYGANPFIPSPTIYDTTLSGNQVVLRHEPEMTAGRNLLSSYDLVRLITMLGWHLHLPQSARLPSAQWLSLESLIRGMGLDTARYIDVALETLGLVNVIDSPVVISKLGLGNSAMTYVAFVKFVDKRHTPAKLRTLAMALWADVGSNITRDNNLAAAVTEIMRRIFTEELA